MPLPPKTDTLIKQRFDELISESDNVLNEMEKENSQKRENQRQARIMSLSELHVGETAFFALRTRFLSLIEFMSSTNRNLHRIADEVASLDNKRSDMKKLKGFIQGVKQDYEAGLLDTLTSMIEAEVTSDYMGQAEQLLGEGIPGHYDYVPAAVLTGAVLEDALRRLCQRQTPPIDLVIVDAKGKTSPKMLNTLIDDLKKAGLYNELKAKQLRAWVDIRNAAAHGEFAKFTRTDVEQMIPAVQTFLADYM